MDNANEPPNINSSECSTDDVSNKTDTLNESTNTNLHEVQIEINQPLPKDELQSDSAKEEVIENRTTQDKPAVIQQTTNYDPKNVHYEGETAIYVDPKTGTQFEWSVEKAEWQHRPIKYELEEDTHVYTDKDGVKYFWDKQKSAWFPKVDDEFMARYQLNYGFVEPPAETPTVESKSDDDASKEEDTGKVKGEKRKASEPTWFDLNETENNKVYVSNLPTDITEEEFIDLMQKCGLVMRDTSSGHFKIKLYKEHDTGYLKGDALCTYIKIESVDLALKLIDGSELRGKRIKVERAKFEMRGAYDPKLKPKMKKRKEKEKLRKQQQKLFDWRPEKVIGDRAKHEKIVIIRNLFDPSIFDTDVGLILEFQEDLREEVSKLGQVKKVIIYDRHPEGVAQINMATPEEADEVVKLLNGRWFMKRQLTSEIWDGKTKFKIAETDAQINDRLKKWDTFLDQGDEATKL